MNILIIGCRKVGSRLASILSAEGHTVSVVDRDPRSFELLDDSFDGYTISGIPIDEDVLRSAGIESCDAVAAVTPDDNVNIMACQIAKEIFRVPKVIARMYDPDRDELFASFGISTICPTNLTANAVKSALMDIETREQTIGSSTLTYSMLPVPASYVGKPLRNIESSADEMLFGVLHANLSITLAADTGYILLDTDRLVYVTKAD